MSLDPVRAARVRRMVPNPSTWHGAAMLQMKRIEGGRIMEYGTIWKSKLASDRIPILSGKTEIVFASVDDLIAAGWAVD